MTQPVLWYKTPPLPRSCRGIAIALTASAALLLVGGCNGQPFELAPARGRVTVNGKPLTAGQVMFAPRAMQGSVEPGRPALANLRDDGTFELATYREGDGAIVGEHMVTLFGPSGAAKLPPGIPSFKRFAVRGEPLRVEANTDNTFEIDIPLEDLQPLKFRGLDERR